MNFAPVELDDDQAAFHAEVRAFCEEVIDAEVHEAEYLHGHGHDWRVHRQLGERGWIYPQWPVEEGGAGLDPVRAALLAFELRRAELPRRGMGTTAMVVGALKGFGRPELTDEVLGPVARGEIICCLGWTEPESGSDIAAASCRAVRDGDTWIIAGQKFFTSGADQATYTFLLTRTNPDVAKHKGLTTFLVPLDSPGIEVQPVRTIGGELTTIVFYDGVRVEDRYRLGEVDQGWTVLSTPLAQEHGEGRDVAMGEVGGYHRHLVRAWHDAVAWARSTRRPDGSAVIDDPVARTRLAREALACIVASEAPAGPPVRVRGSQVLMDGSPRLMDLVGPAALLERGVPGAVGSAELEAAYRVGPETSIYGGTTDIARSLIAEHTLGLPKSRPAPKAP